MSGMRTTDSTPEAGSMKPSAVNRMRRKQSKSKSKEAIVGNIACPDCRARGGDSSGNHLMIFESGSGFCNRCPKSFSKEQVEKAKEGRKSAGKFGFSGQRKFGNGSNWQPEKTVEDISHMGHHGNSRRSISEATYKHFGFKVEVDRATRKPVAEYYPYYMEDELIGYKKRELPKSFGKAVGTIKGSDLGGWHLCTGPKRALFLTEGEADQAAGWQMHRMMNKQSKNSRIRRSNPHYVSLPDGAKGVKKILMHHLEELVKYDKIYWFGDNYKTDPEGKMAMEEAIRVLGPDKFYIAEYPEFKKDLCDVLKMEDAVDVYSEIYFSAKTYRPADIVHGNKLTVADICKKPIVGLSTPFAALDAKMGGIRMNHMSLWTSGSGMGKSSALRMLAHHCVVEHGLTVGNIFLEESVEDTQQQTLAYDNGINPKEFQQDFSIISEDKLQTTVDNVISQMMYLDHNGDIDTDTLLDKMRFFYNKGCRLVILDHISMATAGTDNMTLALEYAMSQLYKFCEGHEIHVAVVVHTNNGPQGSKDVNRGGEVTARHLKGGSCLIQNSWDVITIRGNQMSEAYSMHRFFTVLKTRKGKSVGICEGGYKYNPVSGAWDYDEDSSIHKAMADDVEASGSKSEFQPHNNTQMGGGKSAGKYDNRAS